MQGQLVQKERLSAFGTMASGVAHDFNNALSMILGYSELLLADDDRLSREERLHFVRTRHHGGQGFRAHGQPAAGVLSPGGRAGGVGARGSSRNWRGRPSRSPSRSGRAKPAARGAPIDGRVRGRAGAARFAETRPSCARCSRISSSMPSMPCRTAARSPLRTRAEGAEVVVEVADTGTGMTRGGPPALPGAVLHDQGKRRHRVGPGHGVRHHPAPRGDHGDRERARPGHHFPLPLRGGDRSAESQDRRRAAPAGASAGHPRGGRSALHLRDRGAIPGAGLPSRAERVLREGGARLAAAAEVRPGDHRSIDART